VLYTSSRIDYQTPLLQPAERRAASLVERSSSLSRIAGNTSWLLGGELLGRLLSFVAVLRLTRSLSAGALGSVELGLAIYGFVQMVTLGGLDVLVTRKAARSERHLGRLVAIYWHVGALAYLLTLLPIALLALLSGKPAPAPYMIISFALAAAVSPLGPRFVFVGRERSSVIAVAGVLAQLTWLCALLLLVHGDKDVRLVPFIWMAAELMRHVMTLGSFLRRYGAMKLRIPWRLVTAWARASIPPTIGRAARGVFFTGDLLLLGMIGRIDELGFYTVAIRLPMFLIASADMGQRGLFPSLARLIPAGDRDATGRFQMQSVKAVLSVLLAAVCMLSAVAGPFVTTVFGPHWITSVMLFRILLWRVPFAVVAGLYRNVVWAAVPGLEGRIGFISASFMIASVLVGTFTYGAVGCAAAMVCSELVALALYVGPSKPFMTMPFRGHTSWLLRVGFGVVLAAAVHVYAQGASAYAAIAVAVLAGFVAALLPNVEHLGLLLRRGKPQPHAASR
jgi:O-antigen/teichoic acid export membrane protein